MAWGDGYQINPNLKHLVNTYKDGNIGAVLEGSSRSVKTWSSIDFIVYVCTRVSTDWTINIIKDTYNSFKTTLYDDFNRRLPMYGIQSPFADKQQIPSFRLYGNKINLLGADDEAKFHGASCDMFYCNEVLDISQNVFNQSEQRCRKFFWVDYNPKATDHWVYDKLWSRPDVKPLKTTFLDNPHIAHLEKRKILSYEPTHPEDRHITDPKKRRPHPTNLAEGTADDYMWNVYGLGLRSAPEGLVFQYVTYVNEFPPNIPNVFYGLDFGYTNSPSVLTKVGVWKNHLYAQKLFYAPTPSTNELAPILKKFIKDEAPIWADPSGESGGRGMISQLRRLGFNIIATNTFPGSIKHGISVMKKYKIHLIDDPDVKKEQTNYKFREINGIRLDEPVDAFNHFWDSVRMPVMSNYK